MPPRIAAGGQAEIDDAVQIYVRSALARREGRPLPEGRVKQVTSTLRSPTTWFLVATDGGVTVGMAAAMPARSAGGTGALIRGACYLDLMFVDPARWGQGVGALLLDAVLLEAADRGYASVQLKTHDDNERARRLYRSRGFAPTGWTRPSVSEPGVLVSEWAVDLDE